MPHVVSERIRAAPFSDRTKDGASEAKARALRKANIVIEGIELAANLIFLVGSAMFLHPFAHNMTAFLVGCGLFIIGSVMYVSITLYTLCEAVSYHENNWNFEFVEHLLFLLGALMFLIGTVMYWPPEVDRFQLNWLKTHLSLGVYFNLFSTQFEGTIFFMIGSALFAFASFVNGLNQRTFDTVASKLMTATTSLYLGGSLMFTMGSVSFLPDLGCSDAMVQIGAWLFVIGSAMFVLGSLTSIQALRRMFDHPQNQSLIADAVGRTDSMPTPELAIGGDQMKRRTSDP
eukprot:TRINITY_DN77859_c0_g1_i1.p1 TRINITY_DN77859_c0_g1~~TRINITY_DN77859_c0_g1_i1.p1  ORF type:complete len:288 (-),score=45.87 TRINITY_DN77859_c0_g1_i1:30-893(-)